MNHSFIIIYTFFSPLRTFKSRVRLGLQVVKGLSVIVGGGGRQLGGDALINCTTIFPSDKKILVVEDRRLWIRL